VSTYSQAAPSSYCRRGTWERRADLGELRQPASGRHVLPDLHVLAPARKARKGQQAPRQGGHPPRAAQCYLQQGGPFLKHTRNTFG